MDTSPGVLSELLSELLSEFLSDFLSFRLRLVLKGNTVLEMEGEIVRPGASVRNRCIQP